VSSGAVWTYRDAASQLGVSYESVRQFMLKRGLRFTKPERPRKKPPTVEMTCENCGAVSEVPRGRTRLCVCDSCKPPRFLDVTCVRCHQTRTVPKTRAERSKTSLCYSCYMDCSTEERLGYGVKPRPQQGQVGTKVTCASCGKVRSCSHSRARELVTGLCRECWLRQARTSTERRSS
jgi:hypothetical protein